jgi:predicted component of type VI protein secretion system
VPPKPHRLLLDRVSSYADEAAAYLRRRRHLRKPFARTYYADGRSTDWSADSEEGQALFLAASRLIEVAGPLRRARSSK